MDALGDDSIAVIAGAPAPADEGPFRQDPDLWMLTGFAEPDAVALFDPGHPEERYVLFVRPRDELAELWDGPRAGPEGAIRDHGADAAYPIGELSAKLRERAIGRSAIVYRLGGSHDSLVTGLIQQARAMRSHGVTVPDRIVDPTPVLWEMRVQKTPAELESLRRACAISAEGHLEAMRVGAPGAYEYEVQAALEHRFRMSGSRRNAFGTIVASGPNACVLHYVDNSRRIEQGDLVLVDAGAGFGEMAGDISRTFPADGSFSGPQRDLYEVVLAANEAAVAAVRPGASMKQVHETARRVLAEGMVALGLLPGPVDDALSMQHDRTFFPHGTSHLLGMDVHDVGATRLEGAPRPLRSGMVFTIEPGLYVSPGRETVSLPLLPIDEEAQWERRLRLGPQASKRVEDEERAGAEEMEHPVPEAFCGIGIRIEDDVVVTEGGCEVLTSGVPKAVAEVEAACRRA